MTTYESLLAAYDRETGSTATTNAEQEVCQKIALAGLHRGGFFNHAAFYEGTCLRLFHGCRKDRQRIVNEMKRHNVKVTVSN